MATTSWIILALLQTPFATPGDGDRPSYTRCKALREAGSATEGACWVALVAADPRPNYHRRAARAFDRHGMREDAIRQFELHIDADVAPESAARVAESRTRLAELVQMGSVLITCEPAAASVSFDGADPQPCPFESGSRVAGDYTAIISSDGHTTVTESITVEARVDTKRQVELRPDSPPPLLTPAPATSTVLPWTLTGVGLALVATGGAFNLANLDLGEQYDQKKKDERIADASLEERGGRYETISKVTYAAGGALALGGVVWLLMSESTPPVSVSAGPDGLFVGGTW